MDLTFLYFPYVLICAAAMSSVGFLLDFNGKYHCHTALPFHIPFGFHLLLLVMEIVSVGFDLSLWIYFDVSQIIFFQHFYRQLNQMKGGSNTAELKTSRRLTVAELHHGLKKMLLTGAYFNRVHAMPILITKILCMLDFTVGIFIFLKFVHSQPLIAFMGIYVAVLDGSWYAVVYGRAFTVQLTFTRMEAKAAGGSS